MICNHEQAVRGDFPSNQRRGISEMDLFVGLSMASRADQGQFLARRGAAKHAYCNEHMPKQRCVGEQGWQREHDSLGACLAGMVSNRHAGTGLSQHLEERNRRGPGLPRSLARVLCARSLAMPCALETLCVAFSRIACSANACSRRDTCLMGGTSTLGAWHASIHQPGRASSSRAETSSRRRCAAPWLPSSSATARGGHRRPASRTTALGARHSPTLFTVERSHRRALDAIDARPRNATRTWWQRLSPSAFAQRRSSTPLRACHCPTDSWLPHPFRDPLNGVKARARRVSYTEHLIPTSAATRPRPSPPPNTGIKVRPLPKKPFSHSNSLRHFQPAATHSLTLRCGLIVSAGLSVSLPKSARWSPVSNEAKSAFVTTLYPTLLNAVQPHSMQELAMRGPRALFGHTRICCGVHIPDWLDTLWSSRTGCYPFEAN
jgi:hypothetical protein